MSTETTAGKSDTVHDGLLVHEDASLWSAIETVLRPLASLRLTIILLVLSIFIVWAGTMAQWQTPTWRAVASTCCSLKRTSADESLWRRGARPKV